MNVHELDDLLEDLIYLYPFDNQLTGLKIISDEIITKLFRLRRRIRLFLKKKEIDIKI